MKKALMIILCVLVVVLTALATILIILKSGEQMVISPLSSVGQISSFIPSETQSTESEASPVLTFSLPKKEKLTTTDDFVTFNGNYSSNTVLTLNNEEIVTDNDGNFTVTKELQFGNNTFTFTSGDQTKTFTVYRRFVVISSYSPSTKQSYSAGVKFPISAFAKKGSVITAAFNGTTITLTPSGSVENGFITYIGEFTMPVGHYQDLNLGKVTFSGTYGTFSESFESADIICKKEDIVLESDKNATPSGGKYTDVGSGIITEIVAYQAETFDAGTNTDASKPYNNYLPKGTVDYGSADSFTVKRDGDTYELVTLRCGRTLYKSYRDKPSHDTTEVITQYVGVLPDHNQIYFDSINIHEKHTVISFNVDWKAPFYFELLPQSYNNNLSISDITYNYVDITFCYATVFEGEVIIPEDNPIFSSADVIKNTNDYTLRLHLKNPGSFYGWDSYYDESGKLCFEFLNPATITLTDANAYGADLTGVKILIDVGHGGVDCGAINGSIYEATLNLNLANKINAELSSIGATVYMTRSSDVTSTTDDKLTMLKNLKPDFCIAIHHDFNRSRSLQGVGAYYYYPFQKKAAEYVLDNSFNTGAYNDKTFKPHKYFTLRTSVCPVVLTENGYMSNSFDFGNMLNEEKVTLKAVGIVKGIVEYFTSIQKKY